MAQHVHEMLIDSRQKFLALKANITKFNTWVCTQMDQLHAHNLEAVDLLHYLWKAYKAAPDEDLVTYIKDMKSQAEDGQATYTMEELMAQVENKYEAHLLNEENTWGQLSEDHERIVAMSTEIDMLKKNH